MVIYPSTPPPPVVDEGALTLPGGGRDGGSADGDALTFKNWSSHPHEGEQSYPGQDFTAHFPCATRAKFSLLREEKGSFHYGAVGVLPLLDSGFDIFPSALLGYNPIIPINPEDTAAVGPLPCPLPTAGEKEASHSAAQTPIIVHCFDQPLHPFPSHCEQKSGPMGSLISQATVYQGDPICHATEGDKREKGRPKQVEDDFALVLLIELL
ncbi:hypothetical protein Taro_048924 [Colocasia esculenta]|uniref:Uncharacterized protein n=1 Tax=Colocasia esculenta TaxID=4460 RepID=A0A843X9E2_COLES|nr:hypothetical protein [Colocasia esculenta]